MPEWTVPDNLEELIAANPGSMWEDNQWSPIILTAMGGTSYKGRVIPLAWQIEFQPEDELFEVPNEKILALGVEPDGYGWSNVIQSVFAKHHPEISQELHFSDSEASTCVVWVESEITCKLLMQVTWSLIYGL